MFKRNRNLALPHQLSPQPHRNAEQLNAFRQQQLSPQPLITRIERKPAEQHTPRSNSQGNRFKSRAFHPQEEVATTTRKTAISKPSQFENNNDYYPQPQLPGFPQPSFSSQQELRESGSLLSEGDRKGEESVSTQMSKQESRQSLREVRFGGQIEESGDKAFLRKKRATRSPSILKNGRNILNGSLISDKSRSCSVASGKERREGRGEHNTNHILKQKYRSILNKLQAEYHGRQLRGNRFSVATYNSERQQVPSPNKYRDELFPPVYSSLFSLKKNRPRPGTQIKWMRIGNLFPDRQLVLARPNCDFEVFRSEDGYGEDYLPACLNCLRGSPKLLEKMFGTQGVNPFGIYLVKVYQESLWKYTIIDDFIPVRGDAQGKMEPAFLNVRVPPEGPLDIWPFLLEKAYANYYASYEALSHGNLIDFLEEVTGLPAERVKLKGETNRKSDRMSLGETQAALTKVKSILKAGDVLAVGEVCGNKGMAPIVYNHLTDQLLWHDPFCEFKQRRIYFQSLKDTFHAIQLVSPFKYPQCASAALRKGRWGKGQGVVSPLFEVDYPSIRSFQVGEAGEYSVSVRQRDKRFFHFRENQGDYIWIRAILLQKQYAEVGFRWIAGEYAQKKTINFTQQLEAGEYWLVLESEWNPRAANELVVQVQGPGEVELKREAYREEDRVIERGCLDLAQRYGQLNQINKFICSYNYLTEAVGLIIENIVNERVIGSVSVIRSIRGLKCKSQILPVNGEFYEKVTGSEGQPLLRLSEEMELDIPEGENYTVVLKLRGGVDSKFFRTFDFGC